MLPPPNGIKSRQKKRGKTTKVFHPKAREKEMIILLKSFVEQPYGSKRLTETIVFKFVL